MSCIGCGPSKIIFYPAPEIESKKISINTDRKQEVMLMASDLLISAPKAPQNFQVTSIIDDTTVATDWSDLTTPFETYRVYAFNMETEEIDVIMDEVTTSDVDIRGLQEETEYQFWVVSVRDGVESAPSNYDYAITIPPEE